MLCLLSYYKSYLKVCNVIIGTLSDVSTVGPSGARAPLTFSLLHVIIK